MIILPSFVQWAANEMQGCHNCIVHDNDSFETWIFVKNITRKEIQNWSISAFEMLYIENKTWLFITKMKKKWKEK